MSNGEYGPCNWPNFAARPQQGCRWPKKIRPGGAASGAGMSALDELAAAAAVPATSAESDSEEKPAPESTPSGQEQPLGGAAGLRTSELPRWARELAAGEMACGARLRTRWMSRIFGRTALQRPTRTRSRQPRIQRPTGLKSSCGAPTTTFELELVVFCCFWLLGRLGRSPCDFEPQECPPLPRAPPVPLILHGICTAYVWFLPAAPLGAAGAAF